MGEYATYRGEGIKVGTCEDMYYLRHDQRHLVTGYEFGPNDRFRFPFPDEDDLEPGRFDDSDRGVECHGWRIPADWEGHGSVQFIAHAGYNLCVDCPEGKSDGTEVGAIDVNGIRVHRNGRSGWARIVQQRPVDGVLATIVKCGACGAKWRVPDLEAARPIIDGLLAEADRQFCGRDGWEPYHSARESELLREVARRVEAGYTAPVPA
jgi:hypothetical protein